MESGIWDLMGHGGGAMWVVVAFSVIALAVGIERAIAQWKFVTRARLLGETVTRCLGRGALAPCQGAGNRHGESRGALTRSRRLATARANGSALFSKCFVRLELVRTTARRPIRYRCTPRGDDGVMSDARFRGSFAARRVH